MAGPSQPLNRVLENMSSTKATESPVTHKCAIEQQSNLLRAEVGCCGIALAAQPGQPVHHLRLVAARDLAGGMRRVRELGSNVDLRASAVVVPRDPEGHPVAQA